MAEQTLLLVDDEENIVSAVVRLLRGSGYTILRASSAREGLELLAKHEVGVILSDQRMPEMTGVEFFSQVKELYPRTVRMILSGYADLDSVKDAINRGAIYKFITKPWDEKTLCASIAEAFEHHELVQQKERLLQEIESANATLAYLNGELAALIACKDEQIEQATHYDALTGLPNRLLLLDRLMQEMAHAQGNDCLVAVMVVNLDRFRQVNDSFGHTVGDQLLQIAADRLKSHMRAGDTLARMGGDDFCYVLTGMKAAHHIGEIAQNILDSFACNSILAGNNEIFATVSIGISIYPFDGVGAAELIRNADVALHHAKSEGRSNFQYYAAQMNVLAWQRLTLEGELHRALEREEFVLHYQPKIELISGKVIGMEALLRWQSAERGLVLPGEFIPLLEETGLIVPVGEWVLRTACRQARTWQKLGVSAHIAVNLSALQFRQPDLGGVILGIFRENELDPGFGSLELELTESLLMSNADKTLATLNALHEKGIRFSIDDFGVGYSSLSYLKRFPIDSLKIDQSFVRDLAHDADDAAIVGAIIALGHGLGLKVIAEGVETGEQLSRLRKMKCDEAQGYLFSRPIPVDEMTRLLQSGESVNLMEEA